MSEMLTVRLPDGSVRTVRLGNLFADMNARCRRLMAGLRAELQWLASDREALARLADDGGPQP